MLFLGRGEADEECKSLYSEFHGFRSLLVSLIFRVDLDHFRNKLCFSEAAGAVAKISSSLKLNHKKQIKLSLIYETHCI